MTPRDEAASDPAPLAETRTIQITDKSGTVVGVQSISFPAHEWGVLARFVEFAEGSMKTKLLREGCRFNSSGTRRSWILPELTRDPE